MHRGDGSPECVWTHAEVCDGSFVFHRRTRRVDLAAPNERTDRSRSILRRTLTKNRSRSESPAPPGESEHSRAEPTKFFDVVEGDLIGSSRECVPPPSGCAHRSTRLTRRAAVAPNMRATAFNSGGHPERDRLARKPIESRFLVARPKNDRISCARRRDDESGRPRTPGK